MEIRFKIDVSPIGTQLEAIRKRIGANHGTFKRQKPNRATRIDKDLPDARDVRAVFDPSGTLVADGKVVLVYIRDHTGRGRYDTPAQRKKVHFGVCTKLEEMKETGRIQRYRATNRTDDIYTIDLDAGSEDTELYPCQFCLGLFQFNGFSHDDLPRKEREKHVREFRAAEALRLANNVRNVHLAKIAKNLKSATNPTVYSINWQKVSRRVRSKAGFRCQQCGVTLREKPGMLDTHHRNGDKTDNSETNLVCLCVCCHRDQPRHDHYHVSEQEAEIIRQKREEQKLNWPR